MKKILFNLTELVARAKAASAMVDVDALRKSAPPADGTSFMVARSLFVWIESDKTPDDGVDSVKPNSVAAKSAGRYRLVGLANPLVKG
jgi:hypothetical protein